MNCQKSKLTFFVKLFGQDFDTVSLKHKLGNKKGMVYFKFHRTFMI